MTASMDLWPIGNCQASALFGATGRDAHARALFEEMVAGRTPAGLLSEDIDPATGGLWGAYPRPHQLRRPPQPIVEHRPMSRFHSGKPA